MKIEKKTINKHRSSHIRNTIHLPNCSESIFTETAFRLKDTKLPLHGMMRIFLLRQHVLCTGQQKQQTAVPEINLPLLTLQKSDRERQRESETHTALFTTICNSLKPLGPDSEPKRCWQTKLKWPRTHALHTAMHTTIYIHINLCVYPFHQFTSVPLF